MLAIKHRFAAATYTSKGQDWGLLLRRVDTDRSGMLSLKDVVSNRAYAGKAPNFISSSRTCVSIGPTNRLLGMYLAGVAVPSRAQDATARLLRRGHQEPLPTDRRRIQGENLVRRASSLVQPLFNLRRSWRRRRHSKSTLAVTLSGCGCGRRYLRLDFDRRSLAAQRRCPHPDFTRQPFDLARGVASRSSQGN